MIKLFTLSVSAFFLITFFNLFGLFGQNVDTIGRIKNYQCEPDWEYSVMGYDIGSRSLNAIDIDNDGQTEIICSARYSQDGFWYILKYNPIKKTYEQSWISKNYGQNISRIGVFDINNNSIYAIFVCLVDGSILVYDGQTKQIIGQFSVPVSAVYNTLNDIEFGDADNDGVKEIVVRYLMIQYISLIKILLN